MPEIGLFGSGGGASPKRRPYLITTAWGKERAQRRQNHHRGTENTEFGNWLGRAGGPFA
jgi:hypothetical protein